MISRPRSSMPSGSGTWSNPDARRWRMNAWTVGVHGPAARRTVSPTRATAVMFPPARTSSRSPATPRSYGRLHRGRPDRRADALAVQPRGEPPGLLVERPPRAGRQALEQPHRDDPVGVLHPGADDPAV